MSINSAAVCAVSFFAFIFLSILVLSGKSIYLDNLILNSISFFQKPDLTNLMISLSYVFHPVFLFFGIFILFCLLILLKKTTLALFFLFTIVASSVSAVLLKIIFSIERPVSTLTEAFGPGFPSTHATTATVFFLALLYAIRHKINDRTIGFLFEVIAISFIIFCGLSRLYLSVHWPSDVLAGYMLGLFWVTFALTYIKKYEKKKNESIV